ncbi:hypothetical protein MMC20_003531 [Loxospora ochrophaea]|nr:hypothetical protein [Loxospora ochrophaea]
MRDYGRRSLEPDDGRFDLGNARDLEKSDYDGRDSSNDYEEDSFSPAYSAPSRDFSGSHHPMLNGATIKQKNSYYLYRLPNKIVRYLCLALMSTVIIFILSLVRMSWTSARALELGIGRKPPPPPIWESFDFLTRYYGGIRQLVPREQNVPEYPGDQEPANITTPDTSRGPRSLPQSTLFDPYPDYHSNAYKRTYAPVRECFLDAEDKVRIPKVRTYTGVPKGLPDAVMGSAEVLKLRNDICFERYGRYGPYGLGYSLKRGGLGAALEGEREGADDVWKEVHEVDYAGMNWADAQKRCAAKNEHRFQPKTFFQGNTFNNRGVDDTQMHGQSIKRRDDPPAEFMPTNQTQHSPSGSDTADKKVLSLPRTAVMIRTWWDFPYTQEDILYLRALIAELSLLSGGEFTVIFFIHVKDNQAPIWADQDYHDNVLKESLPEEFHGMGVLWNEKLMDLVYSGLEETNYRNLPIHGVYRSTYMPMQYFAHTHPEYDFFWNWEMDIRYTGHWYHLFDSVRNWAKEQPRKGLWERNGRFYIPSVHGSWDEFKQRVRFQTEDGTDSPDNIWSSLQNTADKMPGTPQGKSDKPIWGPYAPEDVLHLDDDPVPPTTYEKDQYTWGVGEEADLITFNPHFDADATTWLLAEDVTGYNRTNGLPPRRTAIITASRLSRRLLVTMHKETALKKHSMFSEMWPASCALHHGLKAVFAPHPVYIDRNWPTSLLAATFNGGRNGATGGARTSVFGDREHNFRGTTWYYNAGFAPNLWRRWLGYRVDGNGGEEAEVNGEGRMCLPGVLLHPVKAVEMVIDGQEPTMEEPI